MFNETRKNKQKTFFIISLFILFITLIIYYVCTYFNFGTFSIVIALIFSIGSTWSSYYFSDKIILTMSRARPATEDEDRKLVNILDGLMLSSGLTHRPKLYVIESEQLNAFATGRNPENAIICLTTALLENLEYYELEGVVAHELAHIKNYDILLSAVLSVLLGFIIMLSDLVVRYSFRSSSRKSDNDNSNAIIAIIGLIFVVLSPIFATLIQLAVSRNREYLADSTAIEFTRNPNGLINALTKLSSNTSKLETASKSTAHMYMVNPFKNTKKSAKSFFSTHPPIEDRIEVLKNIN